MLTIGQLADATGVPASTIRFWERRGLLRPPARSGGQRRYPEEVLTEIGILLLCQDGGFTLAEIERMRAEQAVNAGGWRDRVRAKMADVDDTIRRLTEARAMLEHALCCDHKTIKDCPDLLAAAEYRITVAAKGDVAEPAPWLTSITADDRTASAV
jgi:DNA-binding transcriptional MerR regulator